jgi:hypothetical protein
MPSPISHLVYARKYLDRHPRVDEAAFIAGSVFPDIHYLADIERSQTHSPNKITPAMVKNELDGWTAGTHHHNVVDDIWNAYVEKNAPEVFADPVAVQALKMLEDEFLYAEIPDWLPVRVALRVVPTEEHGLIPPAVGLKWHSLLNKLVVAPPQRERRESLLRELRYEDEQLVELEAEVKKLRINSNTVKLLTDLSAHIVQTVGNQNSK